MNKVLGPNTIPDLCSASELGKYYRVPVSNMHTRSTSAFDIIYVDLWGLIPINTGQNMKSFCCLLMIAHVFNGFIFLTIRVKLHLFYSILR